MNMNEESAVRWDYAGTASAARRLHGWLHENAFLLVDEDDGVLDIDRVMEIVQRFYGGIGRVTMGAPDLSGLSWFASPGEQSETEERLDRIEAMVSDLDIYCRALRSRIDEHGREVAAFQIVIDKHRRFMDSMIERGNKP